MRRLAAWCVGILLLVMLALPAVAQPIVELRSGDSAPIELGAPALIHVDPAASPDPQALAQPVFRPTTPALLAPGYSAAAFWLRITLHNAEDEPQVRVLALEPARMESVALFFRRLGESGWQYARAGTDQPFSARELPTRESAFVVRVAPGETRELLLRVASRGAVSLRPRLWTPTALLAASTRASLIHSVLFSLPAMIALLSAGLFLALRQPAFGLLAAYLLLALLYEAAMQGAAFALLWPSATDWAQRSLGVLGTGATIAQALTMRQVLGVRQRRPRVDRALLAVIALPLLTGLWCLWGDYRLATQWNNSALFVLIAMTILISAQGVKAGGPLGPAWFFAVLCQQVGVLQHYLSLQGVIPNTDLVESGALLGCVVGSVALVGAVLLQLDRERSRHAQTLEATVRRRTAELAAASARAHAGDAAKGRLLGYIGHDLRAPLASMVQLTRRLGQDREFEATRRAIEHSGLMLLETIDELQRFARSPEAEAAPEIVAAPLYLHGLLIEVVEQAQAMARSGGNELRLLRGAALPAVVELDAKRLRQVLFNLLSNAAKFTQQGQIVLEADASGGMLHLSVSDTGQGIAEADLPLVFEPFVRAAGQGRLPGLGLGLSIARQAVRAMGGDITVRSRPGAGSRFSVELPWQAADEDQVQWPLPQAEPGAELLGEGWLALVLDTCPTAREALAERLALASFDRILQVASLDEARALTAATSPTLLVVEPLTLSADAFAELRESVGPSLALLCCSARPDAPGDLAKPVSHADWWAGLQRGVSGRPVRS